MNDQYQKADQSVRTGIRDAGQGRQGATRVSAKGAGASTISPRRLSAIDIDDGVAAVLVGRFTPADATLGYDATAAKYNIVNTDPDTLEAIRRFDHAWFSANPGVTEYVRELLPDEFRVKLEPAPPGQRWVMKVTAFRDFISGQVMLRIRTSWLMPLDHAPTGGVK